MLARSSRVLTVAVVVFVCVSLDARAHTQFRCNDDETDDAYWACALI